MKRLHVIHHKTINDIDLKSKGKLVSLLETETLDWAKKHKAEAYGLTLPIQMAYQKNPNNGETSSKYFKYLRRLLELKLEFVEELATKPNGKITELSSDIATMMNIETLRILDFLSVSQLQMYYSCPRKYYWRYLRGIKFPKTHALHMGTSFDNTLNVFFGNKIKGIAMPRQAVFGQFYEEFEKGKDEVNWGDQDPKKLLKIGPKMLDAYLDRFESITKVEDVQTECNIHLDNGGRLVGYIDILAPKLIIDTKTANKPWETSGKFAKANQELQPKAYSLWYLQTYNTIPSFRYQIVVKPENENITAQTQLIDVQLKNFELESFLRQTQKAWDDIQAANFLGKEGFPAQADPKSRGNENGYGFGKKNPSVLCCKQYCEYYEYCQKDFGNAVPLAWVSKTKDTPGHHLYPDDVEKNNGSN